MVEGRRKEEGGRRKEDFVQLLFSSAAWIQIDWALSLILGYRFTFSQQFQNDHLYRRYG